MSIERPTFIFPICSFGKDLLIEFKNVINETLINDKLRRKRTILKEGKINVKVVIPADLHKKWKTLNTKKEKAIFNLHLKNECLLAGWQDVFLREKPNNLNLILVAP